MTTQLTISDLLYRVLWLQLILITCYSTPLFAGTYQFQVPAQLQEHLQAPENDCPALSLVEVDTDQLVDGPLYVCGDSNMVKASIRLFSSITPRPGEELQIEVQGMGNGGSYIVDPNIPSTDISSKIMTSAPDIYPIRAGESPYLTLEDDIFIPKLFNHKLPITLKYMITPRLLRGGQVVCEGNDIIVNLQVVPTPKTALVYIYPSQEGGEIQNGERVELEFVLNGDQDLEEGVDYQYEIVGVHWSTSGTGLADFANNTGYGPIHPSVRYQSGQMVDRISEKLRHDYNGTVYLRYTTHAVGLNEATLCGEKIRGFVVAVKAGPQIECPENITLDAAGAPHMNFQWSHPEVSYGVAPVTLKVSYFHHRRAPQGGIITPGAATTQRFSLGTTSVTYTATDARGNSSSCIFLVKVVDTLDPFTTAPAESAGSKTKKIPLGVSESPYGAASFFPVASEAKKINVYPNPSSGLITLDLAGYNGQAVRLDVYDPLGQLLKTQALQDTDTGSMPLDLSSLPNGSYLLRIRVADADEPVVTRRLAIYR